MSGSQDVDRCEFLLDGNERLGARYDDFADVLYLWRGVESRPGISIPANEGHLVRIDPESGELVGFTIFGWEGELKGHGPIIVTVPAVALDDEAPEAVESHTHSLELVPA
jgi:hypothetical protein